MSRSKFESTGRVVTRSLTGLAVAFSLLVFGAAEVAAQTGTLTGLVRNAVGQQPLTGAQVSIDGTSMGGLSNNVGRFLLLSVPAGQVTVTVQSIGFGSVSQTVTVVAGETATLDFELRSEALALEALSMVGAMGPFQGRGFLGYDNHKKKYFSLWMDSMSTGVMMSEGTCDDSHKVFTYVGAADDPWTGEPKKFRSVLKVINEAKLSFEMFETGEDGKEKKSLEVNYTRA